MYIYSILTIGLVIYGLQATGEVSWFRSLKTSHNSLRSSNLDLV